METRTIPPDPVELVDRLDAETIRTRLADLDRQSRALRVLLRAAVTRRGWDERREETHHAD